MQSHHHNSNHEQPLIQTNGHHCVGVVAVGGNSLESPCASDTIKSTIGQQRNSSREATSIENPFDKIITNYHSTADWTPPTLINNNTDNAPVHIAAIVSTEGDQFYNNNNNNSFTPLVNDYSPNLAPLDRTFQQHESNQDASATNKFYYHESYTSQAVCHHMPTSQSVQY